jgi:hypothetical protein
MKPGMLQELDILPVAVRSKTDVRPRLIAYPSVAVKQLANNAFTTPNGWRS